ncbi:MAG TPA: hypothetical protein VK387_00945 [Thermoleophilaceae bacterium]|jgi:hypothetical protein|nr:hypothetical protein [Thermoleophilaceae bacterium]
MTARDEGTDENHEDRAGADEQDAHPAGEDQAHRTAPPGNPEADEDAVEKGEDNIGRITGR